MLLREGKTAEARKELEAQRKQRPNDAEVIYQIARSHLLDFYAQQDPEQRRVSLALAMEMLGDALKHDPDHIPALRAKAVIHARAELLYYDPNLSYELAARVAKLEPHANAFLLNLSEWMSGEVRFTQESGHRVPHDPLIGLDRSIDLLGQVIDSALPYSNEETAAYFLMGNTLSRRGSFREAIRYYEQELRATSPWTSACRRCAKWAHRTTAWANTPTRPPSSTRRCSGAGIRWTSGSSPWRSTR